MIAPWYVMAFVGLDRVAHRHGYALALHGSLGRDLDVVFIPWTDDADAPDILIEAIRKFVVGKASKNISYSAPHRQKKPHGRVAYAFPIGHDGHYLDVSVLPRQDEKPADNRVALEGNRLNRKKKDVSNLTMDTVSE